MVILHTSFLALTLVMGSALASSNEYQRREFGVQSSGPSSFRVGLADAIQSRGFVDEEDLFVRDLDAFDEVEARAMIGKIAGGVIRHGMNALGLASTAATVYSIGRSSMPVAGAASYRRRDLEDNENLFERDLDVEELFGREYEPLDERDTIDNEYLFVRDLDPKELFGREYDLLDERDIIDNEDLFLVERGLEVEELFGREYDL